MFKIQHEFIGIFVSTYELKENIKEEMNTFSLILINGHTAFLDDRSILLKNNRNTNKYEPVRN